MKVTFGFNADMVSKSATTKYSDHQTHYTDIDPLLRICHSSRPTIALLI